MRVVAINGSARKNGNTSILLQKVSKPLADGGAQIETFWLGHNLKPCLACYRCYETKDNKCIQKDNFNQVFETLLKSDALIVGSPVYVADVSPQTKAFIDRACLVARANDSVLKRKVGAAVVAVRRGGAIHAFDSINHFFGINQMITVGSTYWNFAFGRNIGEVESDSEAMENMKNLGENILWLTKKTGANNE